MSTTSRNTCWNSTRRSRAAIARGSCQVRGKIRNLHTGHESLFRVWLEDASDSIVPVRIEFQPRSFLRLTFEAVPA